MLLSESLGVSAAQLWKLGVFDSYLGIDSLLHVDPARLRSTRVPELKGTYNRFHDYFARILDLIEAAQPGDALERQAINALIFPEVREAALGFAEGSNAGRGVTRDIAERLYATARAIIKAGIKNPAIFEIAVLFEEKFGPDLISDMTIFMILEELSQFNKRVAAKLNLETVERTIRGKTGTFVFSKSQQKAVLLIPASLLADLRVATKWSEIDDVVEYNDSIRKKLNGIIKKAWKRRAESVSKADTKAALLQNPQLLREILDRYSKIKAEPYDFEADPRGQVRWYRDSREYAKEYPLDLRPANTTAEVFTVVQRISEHFKHLIEQKGLDELLFDSNGHAKNERASQLLYFGIADAYCFANNLDLSREPQTGRGPADFKVSRGYHERVIVEVKLSSNGKYIDGLTAQLPTYLHAEKAQFGLLLLIKVGERGKKLTKIFNLHKGLRNQGKRVPDLLIVDATSKLSASKLKGFFDLDELD